MVDDSVAAPANINVNAHIYYGFSVLKLKLFFLPEYMRDNDNRLHNDKKLHHISCAVLGAYDIYSTCVWIPLHVHMCIISEINNKKKQNNEGIFQEMTCRIHMHFTKASDVPLNDFNEYWGAVEQERENKIDSGFKKEEAFFLRSLMPSVWQWLSFVKEQCCALFQQLHDNDEKKTLQ